MPEGNKSRVSGVGVESNRPATNFPGIPADANRVDCLVEKIGLDVESHFKARPVCRRHQSTDRGDISAIGNKQGQIQSVFPAS